ncbi:MAG: A24 family peptidase [Nanoarchaeota archaeon]|nr:A24 family peptidase [Nanoarchaeota archaeon]
MPIELILITITLLVLAAAALFDLKSREIPDTLSYGFIATVLGIRLIYSFYYDFSYILYGLAGLGIFYLFGLIMYYSKQWGGGDSKIFIGIGIAFADFYLGEFPLLLILLLIVFFVGTIYAFIWSIALFIKHYKIMVKSLKDKLRKSRKLRLTLIPILIILLFFVHIILGNPDLALVTDLLVIATFLLLYLIPFIRIVEKHGFTKDMPLSKVTEGDWLAEDVRHNGKILVSQRNICLEKEHLALFKKNKIRKVKIKYGIPFVPAIFIGTIITFIVYFI